MRKFLLILSLFCIVTSANSQSKSQSKNSFIFTTGLGYRITPVDFKKNQQSWYDGPVYFERDRHVSGLALNVGLLYYWLKQRIGFEYSNSFRHDHLYFYDEQGFNAGRVLTCDLHLAINKFFPLRKNMLRTGIGYSFLNKGSDYSYTTEEVNSFGDTILHSNMDNLDFSTFNISIGYQINQLSFELVNRFTTQHKFPSQGQFYIPELRITYGLKLNNRKIYE